MDVRDWGLYYSVVRENSRDVRSQSLSHPESKGSFVFAPDVSLNFILLKDGELRSHREQRVFFFVLGSLFFAL